MTSDQARARAHELLFPVEYSVQHEGVAAEIARLESERDTAVSRAERAEAEVAALRSLINANCGHQGVPDPDGRCVDGTCENSVYRKNSTLRARCERAEAALADALGGRRGCTCGAGFTDHRQGPGHCGACPLVGTSKGIAELAEDMRWVSAERDRFRDERDKAEAALARDNHALADAREEVKRLKARRFPVHTPEGIGCPSSVPWSALAPHEAWALRNHDQDLETLARRGGLGVCEMVAIIEGRRWTRMDNAAAIKRLLELLAHCPMCGVERADPSSAATPKEPRT